MLRQLPVIGAVILLATAPLAAGTPAVAVPGTAALELCLAHLAGDPHFVRQSSEALGASSDFAESAKHYCADEIAEFWSAAHSRARQKLGLPDEGEHAPDQQRLVQQEMSAMILAAWPAASAMRANPPSMDHDRMAFFIFTWLLDDENVERLIDEKAAMCAKDKLGNSSLPEQDLTDLARGRFSARMTKLLNSCGYKEWRRNLDQAVAQRFPTSEPAARSGAINLFIGQVTFWAALSQP